MNLDIASLSTSVTFRGVLQRWKTILIHLSVIYRKALQKVLSVYVLFFETLSMSTKICSVLIRGCVGFWVFFYMQTLEYLCSSSALDTFSRDLQKPYRCSSGQFIVSEETGSGVLLMRNPV